MFIMKISNIVFYNQIFQPEKTFKQEKSANCNKNMDFIPDNMEILGRSQVYFSGNDFRLNPDDKKFIDVVSRDLRFSDEQKKQFTGIVKDYLKENKFNNLEEMDGEDNNQQAYFLNKVSENMDLSDADFDVLSFHIVDRIYCEGVYLPDDRRFVKDLPIIEPILEQYGFDREVVDTLTDSMFIDAENFECKALFDIFNQHSNEIEDTVFFNALTHEVDDDTALNIIIDLSLKSKEYEKYGENIFSKNTERAKFYNSMDDECITDDILAEFNIAEEEGENIFRHVIKRHADVPYQQIAFEIADEYNLSEKADKKIIEILKTQEKIGFNKLNDINN